ncbi:CPBP family glutamic-type intramembrane protease [Clostridium sp. LBM24168]
MIKSNVKYFMFLMITLILSVPFYIWGAFFPVKGLPFGLPISFLMIMVPFFLSLIYAWKENGIERIIFLFKSIFDINRASRWWIIFCLACMPLVAVLTYSTMRVFSFSLPAEIVFPYREIPLMIALYFLGAIPEEFGWTATLTEPLTKKYGPIKAGIIIGGVWAVWHIIPWSWAHPAGWIIGMCILNVFMRTAMIYAYMYGGKSLFTGLAFHTMINVATCIFPNYGSHVNTWLFSAWMAVVLLMVIWFVKRKNKAYEC